MTSSWLPAATLAVGIVGTLGGQVLSGLLTERREHRARTAQRDIERNAFQRDVLIELQDVLLALMRNTFQINVHHQRIFRETGRFARNDIPADLDEESRMILAAVSKVKQRVLDDELRGGVTELRSGCVKLTSPYLDYMVDASLDDSARASQATTEMVALATKFSEFEDMVGGQLRRVL